MKKFTWLIAILLITMLCSPALGYEKKIYFEMPFRTLLEEPSPESAVAYEIPVDVKLVGMTADGKWYKMKVAYDLLFLGHYEYSGWVYAPVEDYLTEPSEPGSIPAAK